MTERRFLLISLDGRHTTLSRDAPPDEETVDIAAEGLDSVGMAGWLVAIDGSPADDGPVEMLRRLTHAQGDWSEALSAFRLRRPGSAARR